MSKDHSGDGDNGGNPGVDGDDAGFDNDGGNK